MNKRKESWNKTGYKIESKGRRTRKITIYWHILEKNPNLLVSLILSDKLFVSPIKLGEKIYPNKSIKVYQFVKDISYCKNKNGAESKTKNLKPLIKDASNHDWLINEILDVLDKDKNNFYLFSISSHFDRILNNPECELKMDDYGTFIEKFITYTKNRISKNNQSKIKKLNIFTLMISILSIITATIIGIFEIIKK